VIAEPAKKRGRGAQPITRHEKTEICLHRSSPARKKVSYLEKKEEETACSWCPPSRPKTPPRPTVKRGGGPARQEPFLVKVTNWVLKRRSETGERGRKPLNTGRKSLLAVFEKGSLSRGKRGEQGGRRHTGKNRLVPP